MNKSNWRYILSKISKKVNNSKQSNKKFKIPHTYVLIFSVIIIMALLTYIVPAGEFGRVEDPVTGRRVVDPGSYQNVEQLLLL
jgi:uncharacterized ion transporter superfamily protein YfcC